MRWDKFYVANDMKSWPVEDNERKVNYLLPVIGVKALKKYDNFPITDPDKISVDNVLRIIEKKIIPKTNKTYNRAMFNLCNQQDEDNFDMYRLKLRKFVRKNQYGDMAKELLEDRLICNRSKKLFFSKQTMPKPLSKQAKGMVASLIDYFEQERDHGGPLIPVTSVRERVAAALKVNLSTVTSVWQAVKQNQSLNSPKRKRSRSKPITMLDDASQVAIRNTIYQMYEHNKRAHYIELVMG
ncbi:putative phospholipid-transporting atpase [Holotrichia oblita]|uniref:Phospholipid-transporting atpase n=1 Tax=Holotrichia oblita TaxID=644536 RepID=A0ACB9SU64_HOLOL|nr:putative phospholipid-transporting atpase [Holotrichia oblita]